LQPVRSVDSMVVDCKWWEQCVELQPMVWGFWALPWREGGTNAESVQGRSAVKNGAEPLLGKWRGFAATWNPQPAETGKVYRGL
jgi:hypothetical protein